MIYASTDLFNPIDINQFTIKTLPPKKDTRGFLYIVVNSVFPKHIKIGYTVNVSKRLTGYNSDQPYPTTRMLLVTKEFSDAILVEKKVLEYLYKTIQPTTLKKEWFEIKHKDVLIYILEEAEKHFD